MPLGGGVDQAGGGVQESYLIPGSDPRAVKQVAWRAVDNGEQTAAGGQTAVGRGAGGRDEICEMLRGGSRHDLGDLPPFDLLEGSRTADSEGWTEGGTGNHQLQLQPPNG